MRNIGVVGRQHPWVGSRVDYEDVTGVWYVNGAPVDSGTAQQLQPYVVAVTAANVSNPGMSKTTKLVIGLVVGIPLFILILGIVMAIAIPVFTNAVN